MKTIIKAALPIFLVTVMLSSCNNSTSTSQTNPTKAMGTALSPAWTDVAEIQMAIPTVTPTVPLPTTLPSTTPEITPTPSITTEEDSFWENIEPMPSNISITEYALPPDKDPTKNDGLFQFVPTQAWPVRKTVTSSTPHKITLKEIGYELRTVYTDRGVPYCQQLYRDDRLLFDCDVDVSNIYTVPTESGSITAFIVYIDLGNETFLIQNDAIYAWGGYAIDTSAPILYKGELLWARTYSDRVEIKKSNGDIVFTLKSSWWPNHRPKFRAWNGHWILEENNSVILDGEFVNQNLEFQEIFSWSLVNDKPTYFFRKGSRIGLSYGDRILLINYQNVAHNLCCGPGQNNPFMGNDGLHFFGERDGIWYYVLLEFK